MRTVLILSTIVLILSTLAQARDPDAPPPEYYGERETVGGSGMDGGDIFLMITLPLVVAAIILLPHIFDGEYQDWPVYKFRLHLLSNVNKFPTRRL